LSFVGDWRYYQFPTNTFGLGSHTTQADILSIDYSYLKFHQVVLREIIPDYFIGLGYHLDHYSDIEIFPAKTTVQYDFQRYGYSTHSNSSGLSMDFVYDDRQSSVNPQTGTYASFMYRNNPDFLGSDFNWQSIVIDVRKYFHFPLNSENVFALWSYNNFIIKGNPPYLELPYTAGDSYSNTGRGYPMGRFRGKEYMYLESEYRFGILNNGLINGVVFANASSFSNWPSNELNGILPGGGIGLRIKINRHSNTNIALDYGLGTEGSRGFFFNVGEVF
jgi:outer membrane protein assembly factor BamA